MLKDLEYAVRVLRKNPGFVAVALCSLAIGIGANSAMYSVADGMLLRPLAVLQPSRVVTIQQVRTGQFGNFSAVSYPDYVDLRDHTQTFSGVIASQFSFFGFAPDQNTVRRMKFGMFASGNFFDVLGVHAAVGRTFRPDEDQVPGRDAVVVLSHDLWASDYNSDPSIVNRKLWLNGIEFTVVGVAPESFKGIDQYVRPAMYIPLAMAPRLGNKTGLTDRASKWLVAKARLKPGVSIAQAEADVAGVVNGLKRSYGAADESLHLKVESELETRVERSPPDTQFIVMLAVLSLCVLAVACANVAGLLLSRSAARSREIAVRLAIGAGRGSIIRQLLLESLLIALAGGVLSLLVAYGMLGLFARIPPPPTDIPISIDFHLDVRALLFTACVSIFSTILFGLAPALRASRPDLVPALKATDGVTTRRQRLVGRNLIVGAQITLSVVLLILSGVLVQGFRSQLLQGPGFKTEGLYLMGFDTGLVNYKDADRDRFYRDLLRSARLVPGVHSAALTSGAPMTPSISNIPALPEERQLRKGEQMPSIFNGIATDGYFETMGIPIVRGRGFLESDKADSLPVVVVNEEFAKHFWPGKDPIGKRIRIGAPDGKLAQVVGIAKTTKYIWITESPMDFLYLPASQNSRNQMTLVAAADANVTPALRNIVQSIDRGMPVFDIRTMHDLYTSRAVKTPNLIVQVVATLGLMGLLLAVVGLYGLMAYSVSRRTREIGIRMAIGADQARVLGMVITQGMRIGLVGIGLGLIAGFLASRALTSIMIFSFQENSVVPEIAVVVLLLVTVGGAAYVPARRAARIDPLRALREE